MKIGIISTKEGEKSWGASEELWAATARRALEQGHRVGAAVMRWRPRAPQVQALAAAGMEVFEPPRVRSPRVNRVADRLRFRYAGILGFRPDVLLVSQGATYDLPYTLGAPGLERLLGRNAPPLVIFSNGNRDDMIPDASTRRLARELFARARRVCFVAEHNRLAAERQLACDIRNAAIVRVPLNLGDTSVVAWPEGTLPRLCCVARLDARGKGHDALLAALAPVPWTARPWELRLVGSGPDEGYLRELAAHLGLAQRVQFPGHTNDIRAVWGDNHLMVLPSRGEGLSLALQEAMLCGRAAVVTDVGDSAVWAQEGLTGFVADAATPRALSAALERAWAAQSRWRSMGQAAHDLAATRMDPDPARSMLDLLVSAAAESKS